MSDEQKPTEGAEGQPPQPDLAKLVESLHSSITNMKAEFNRKLDSVATRAYTPPPPPTPQKKPLGELIYEDPEAALGELASSVKSEVVREVTKTLSTVERNRALHDKLMSDYPELQDPTNPLTVKANEYFGSLSEEERSDPRSLKAAVLEAAVEMGLAPQPKRKKIVAEGDDSFTLSSGQPRTAPKKKGDVTDSTLEFAALVGLDVSKKEVVDRLKERSKRDFKKYGA